LGCLSLTAVTGAVVGLAALLLAKLMPVVMSKMMVTMMPRMTAAMEEAGVQPPCAKIVLEHMESESSEE
jgi:hypothetical protein